MDDDWELFVPAEGERYPPLYQFMEKGSTGWRTGFCTPDTIVEFPDNDNTLYRKPKPKFIEPE